MELTSGILATCRKLFVRVRSRDEDGARTSAEIRDAYVLRAAARTFKNGKLACFETNDSDVEVRLNAGCNLESYDV